MSKPHRAEDEATSCTGKQRFDTATAAERVAGLSNRRGEKNRQRVYRCVFCHGWHLGGSAWKGTREKAHK